MEESTESCASERIPEQTYDVAVIGAGIGGLTAAALLAHAGAKVALVEQHVVPGGFCHSWWRSVRHGDAMRRFRFDAGAMDISGVGSRGAIGSVLERLGISDQIVWLPLEHTYRYGALSIDVAHDCDAYIAELCARFPESAVGIKGFFAAMRAVYEAQYHFAAENGGIRRAARTEAERAAYAASHPFAVCWESKPVMELLRTFVTHRQAQAVLLFLSYYLGDQRSVISVKKMADIYAYYFDGGFYPQGGTGKFADVLMQAVRAKGGTVLLKSSAQRILVKRGRVCGVELAKGRRLAADHVISNVDIKRTFAEFIGPEFLPADFHTAITDLTPACSGFCVYLGVDFTPDVKSYTVSTKDGPPNFAFHVPSIVDASAAPPGYAAFEIRTLLANKGMHNWFPDEPVTELNAGKTWRRSLEYNTRKRIFGDHLLAQVEAVVPDLRKHIVYRCDASPVTYARYSGATNGAVYGFDKRLESLEFGKTPIDNLFVAGSGSKGAGVEAAVISGANAAEAIIPGLLASDLRAPFVPHVDASDVRHSRTA
ncbi:MAG: NAD(P)/FAD-dependent oxidoreductase [Candidatus Obscuribacterales bacterium]|nr:NAD(P)/FAD-dependent oxidoreductase [Steroidobacteraceae bacterium]